MMDGVKAAAVGYVYTMALKKDGSFWVFGWNSDGSIGNGGINQYQPPVKVMDNVEFISAGDHLSAVKNDGSLWCWGF